MGQPDAVLFVISQINMSARKQQQLGDGLTAAAAPLASHLIRLEGTGPNLPSALDDLRDAGYRDILVQPVGLPFTESLIAWLPGALATWRMAGTNSDVTLRVGQDTSGMPDVLGAVAKSALSEIGGASEVDGVKPSLGKPGWQNPPDFVHHLLVCTGPRCQFRDAASLVQTLKEEMSRQGVSDQCLTARTGCLFPCNQGPMIALYPKGEWYRLPRREDVTRFVAKVLVGGRTAHDLLIHTARSSSNQGPSS